MNRDTAVIIRALSGFYYVQTGDKLIRCRARGVFRREGCSPLVGDRVEFEETENGNGIITGVLPRLNDFIRPAVSNVELFVIVASGALPVTDPFLIDRVSVLAEYKSCDVVVCINKSDLDTGDELSDIYSLTNYGVVQTSASTGEGISALYDLIRGKISVFTGNSGVGKSSIINSLSPGFDIAVGEVSEKLGRGRHTTRHVELFSLGENTYIADTPGFASFDIEQMEHIPKEELQLCFSEFEPCLNTCRFSDCKHIKEPGCSVLKAVEDGVISKSRHDSYVRLYGMLAKIHNWERRG